MHGLKPRIWQISCISIFSRWEQLWISGKDGKPVRTGFGMADKYAHGRPTDILVTEGADFANPKPGRIQERVSPCA